MKLNTVAKNINKTLEVIYLIGVALALVFLVMTIITPNAVYSFVTTSQEGGKLSFTDEMAEYSYIWNLGVKKAMAVVRLVTFSAVLKALCYTMIFRNIYLIFSYAEGKGKYSQGKTPFQKDIVRMVRELGIFTLLISVVNFLFSLVATAMTSLHLDTFNISVESIAIGIAMIGLSQFFAYGEKLEEEVEGLV